MWLILVGLTLLAGDVLSQDQRPIVAPVRTATSSATFARPIAHTVRASSSDSPCSPSPCGPNTRCEVNNRGIALCRCIEDYVPDGNTINGCKPQCVSDNDCPDDYQCQRNKCARVCVPGACGLNADCFARNHRADCACPSGYNGNPQVRCSREIPEIRAPPPLPVDPCIPNPCGTNSDCRPRGERAVCSCPVGYEGNPLEHCQKGECVSHTDCPRHLACQNLRCIDPCVGVCGNGAECTVRDHQPVCSCPRSFMGDPFTSCRRITEYDICNPTPCGRNTNCRARTDRDGSMRAVCSCIDNYIGSPLTECRPECVRDTDCSPTQHCRDNRCRNPCVDGCGEGAYCDVRNHRAVCTCPEFYQGDPNSRCYPECTKHEDCRDFEACYQFQCIDPCDGACGSSADCKVENHTPICSCPRGYTGDPFRSCRAFTLEDLCRDEPCGTNAECHPGKDRSGNDRPVCTCPVGYIGNPLVSCQRGECQDHESCPDHEACYAYMCQSPCYTEVGSVCGDNAECKVKNHKPVCSCPRGYDGDPLSSCRIAANARIAGRSHRKQ